MITGRESKPARIDPLPPRSVIGILGSGQLGKMLVQAASRLGFRTHVYADDSGPADTQRPRRGPR